MISLIFDCQVEFDSDVLKRMLQSLFVLFEDLNIMDYGFYDDFNALFKFKKFGLVRVKSLNIYDRVKKQKNEN